MNDTSWPNDVRPVSVVTVPQGLQVNHKRIGTVCQQRHAATGLYEDEGGNESGDDDENDDDDEDRMAIIPP